jgi:branched-subunit amino acid aminotransferase/4-amino-4-deoxychorismate lyase
MVPAMTKPEDLVGRQRATSGDEFSDGCAWVSGRYLPIHQAGMPLTDAGITRSDLTYDVVAVWEGRFFRLDDHIDRLLRGCERIRVTPPLTREQIRDVLIECVRRSGLRAASCRSAASMETQSATVGRGRSRRASVISTGRCTTIPATRP